MTDPPVTEGTMVLLENLLGILLGGGLAPQDAAWAADILALLVTYAAIEGDVRRLGDQELSERICAHQHRYHLHQSVD